MSNVDLTGIAPPDVQTITVTYAGATYDISSLIHVTLPALSIPSATGTGTFTFTAPNPIYVNVNSATTGDDGSLTHPFHSIQAGIDAAVAGDMIYVFPGSYNETATNRTLTAADGGGTYQFGLFFPADKPGLSVVGTDSSWNPITDASAVQANVTTNGTANFGPDGVLIEGANDTIQALNIGENIGGMNKSIEVVADNFTLMDSVLSDPEGGDL
ncbi:MAG: hypothetical protein P4M11_05115 [Candidatus Pacebacteria bacterium]|nr:hypothetical protein [Candidatus Paceibacterota bacterium]